MVITEELERYWAAEICYRCPSIGTEALKVLRSRGIGRQLRWRWLVRQALRDPEANWTDEELRVLLALADEEEDDDTAA